MVASDDFEKNSQTKQESEEYKLLNYYGKQYSIKMLKLRGETNKKENADPITLKVSIKGIKEIMDRILHINVEEALRIIEAHETNITRSEELLENLTNKDYGFKREINKNPNNDESNNNVNHTPKIKLQEFDGEILKFKEFWECFENTIHNNRNLSNVVKLTYLKSLLKGKAKRLIEGFSVTNENYEEVIETLKERYYDENIIISMLHNKLINLKTSKLIDNQFIDTFEKVNQCIRQLKAYGEEINNNQTKTIIFEKLPSIIRLKVIKKDAKYKYSTIELLKYVNDSIKAYRINEECQNRNNLNKFNQNTFFANDKKPNCIYCNQNHWSDECKTYNTIEERKSRIEGRCFVCFSKDHNKENCKKRKSCYYCKKFGLHHSSLCPTKYNKQKVEKSETVLLATSMETKLQILPIKIKNPLTSKEIKVNALLDSGSNKSFITNKIVEQLKLTKKSSNNISISTFGNQSTSSFKANIVNIELCSKRNKKLLQVNTINEISNPIYDIKIPKEIIKKVKEIKNVVMTNKQLKKIDLLIGIDYYWDIVKAPIKEISDGLYLINTIFGNMISGRIESQTNIHKQANLLTIGQDLNFNDNVANDKNYTLHKNLEFMWNLELLGIKDKTDTNENDIVQKEFESNIYQEDNRYVVSFPWKHDNSELPSNFELAKGRLISLIKRSNQTLIENYDTIFQEQLKSNIIEEVEINNYNDGHYIPHHAVTSQSKTTKIRIVFDASAKSKKCNLSLNDCLYKGPVIIEDLCGILIRFRIGKIALTADIEKAYHQLSLNKIDRKFTKFLWIKDFTKPVENSNLKIFQFARVPFGIVCSPYLLQATITFHLNKQDNECYKKITKSIYVDNLVHSVDNIQEANQLINETTKYFQLAKFNLRQWKSNKPSLKENVPNDKWEQSMVVKTLGILWNSEKDILMLNQVNIPHRTKITKRTIAEDIARIYDPLGLISPCTIKLKSFLQKLWKENLDWDDVITENLKLQWNNLTQNVNLLNAFTIDRRLQCLKQSNKKVTYDLICFCDASQLAYSCVVYLKVNHTNEIKTSIIFSKSRLAPLKPVTIPKLELMAALLGAKAINYIENIINIKIINKYIFSDSKCVLNWIKSNKTWPLFIKNRINEIKKIKNLSWYYVESGKNPADIPSRGMDIDVLQSLKLWWDGPLFINDVNEKWKINTVKDDENIECNRKENQIVLFNADKLKDKDEFIDILNIGIDLRKYSNLRKVKRIIGWVFRFISYTKKLKENINTLTVKELQVVMLYLIQETQTIYFKKEFDNLKNNKSNSYNLRTSIYLDNNNIIRCGSRFKNSDLTNDEKYPYLLPKKAHLTKLIIKEIHEENNHCGKNETLMKFLSKYWTSHSRTVTNYVVKSCQFCKLLDKIPYKLPPFPNLPDHRVKMLPPFSIIGIDMAGPFNVLKSNQKVKCWICLFTCSTIRAVHLEVANSLSAEDLLLCIRRFVARRGYPLLIISDNATNFKMAAKIIKKNDNIKIRKPSIMEEFFENKEIRWKFITEYAPWMGGFYERLIGLVKNSLKKTINNRLIELDHFTTIITEVETIVNLRPLTYINTEEISRTICPADFINYNPNQHLWRYEIQNKLEKEYILKKENSAEIITNLWKRGQMVLQNFWKKWKEIYLIELRNKKQIEHKQGKCQNIIPKIGDIVHVLDKTNYNSWKLGKISKLHYNEENEVISVTLRCCGKIIKRSIKHVAFLEAGSAECQDKES